MREVALRDFERASAALTDEARSAATAPVSFVSVLGPPGSVTVVRERHFDVDAHHQLAAEAPRLAEHIGVVFLEMAPGTALTKLEAGERVGVQELKEELSITNGHLEAVLALSATGVRVVAIDSKELRDQQLKAYFEYLASGDRSAFDAVTAARNDHMAGRMAGTPFGRHKGALSIVGAAHDEEGPDSVSARLSRRDIPTTSVRIVGGFVPTAGEGSSDLLEGAIADGGLEDLTFSWHSNWGPMIAAYASAGESAFLHFRQRPVPKVLKEAIVVNPALLERMGPNLHHQLAGDLTPAAQRFAAAFVARLGEYDRAISFADIAVEGGEEGALLDGARYSAVIDDVRQARRWVRDAIEAGVPGSAAVYAGYLWSAGRDDQAKRMLGQAEQQCSDAERTHWNRVGQALTTDATRRSLSSSEAGDRPTQSLDDHEGSRPKIEIAYRASDPAEADDAPLKRRMPRKALHLDTATIDTPREAVASPSLLGNSDPRATTAAGLEDIGRNGYETDLAADTPTSTTRPLDQADPSEHRQTGLEM